MIRVLQTSSLFYYNDPSDNILPTRPRVPEHRLLEAMLAEALLDLNPRIGDGGETAEKRKRIRAAAHAWFTHTGNEPGSLEWVCAHLNLEPDYVRRLSTHARRAQWKHYHRG